LKELKNASLALVGTIAAMPLQIAGAILIARVLGPTEFGIYSFAVTFSYLFACFADGGLSILATREIARHRDDFERQLGSLLVLKAGLSFIFMLLTLVSLSFYEYRGEDLTVLLVVALGNFASSACIFAVGMTRAFNLMKIEGLMNFIQPFSFVALFLLGSFVYAGGDFLLLAAICFSLSYLATLLAGIFCLREIFFRQLRYDEGTLKYLAREALGIAIGWVVLLIYSRIGVIILEAGAGVAEVGYFNAALRLVLNLGVLPYILAGAWLPVLTRTVDHDPTAFSMQARALCKYLCIGAVLLAVPLSMAADDIILLIYGREYLPAAPVFAVLMWAMFFFIVLFAPKTFLESSGRQKRWAFAAVSGLIVNMTMSYLLVPRFGAVGAAWGLFAANAVMAFLAFLCSPPQVQWGEMQKCMIVIAAGGGLAWGTAKLIRPYSGLLSLLVSSIVFLIYLFMTSQLRWDELLKIPRRQSV